MKVAAFDSTVFDWAFVAESIEPRAIIAQMLAATFYFRGFLVFIGLVEILVKRWSFLHRSLVHDLIADLRLQTFYVLKLWWSCWVFDFQVLVL